MSCRMFRVTPLKVGKRSQTGTRSGSSGRGSFFAARRLEGGELLIVASNTPARAALAAYRKRWAIECLFSDTKTRGLNLEDAAEGMDAFLNKRDPDWTDYPYFY